jgi:Protein of unknown function (DUF1344)
MRVFNNVLVTIAVAAAPNFTVGEALAQRPGTPPPTEQRPPSSGVQTPRLGAEKRVEGEVKSVNPSGTEITLTDGTTLVTPAGAAIQPGVLTEGSMVVANYREENGKNVLTDLALLREPAASPPTTPRSPGQPPTAPPTGSPPRY